jgi:hypothetical protein
LLFLHLTQAVVTINTNYGGGTLTIELSNLANYQLPCIIKMAMGKCLCQT